MKVMIAIVALVVVRVGGECWGEEGGGQHWTNPQRCCPPLEVVRLHEEGELPQQLIDRSVCVCVCVSVCVCVWSVRVFKYHTM